MALENLPVDAAGLFDRYDASKDGELSYEEWSKQETVVDQYATPEDLKLKFKNLDTDNSNSLTLAEFKAGQKSVDDLSQQDPAQLFAGFDGPAKDGFVTFAEWKASM